MTSARWWFVRHGESVANAGGWLSGHRDVPLTGKGRDQARALAGALGDVSPARVWSSDLRRAAETAAIAWAGREPAVRLVARLRERHLGAWEGLPIAQLREAGRMSVLWSWTGAPPGGESHLDLSRRAVGFLAEVDDGADTLVFAHGGLLRCVVGLLDGRPLEEIGRDKVGNVEVLARTAPVGAWAAIRARL